MHILIGFERFPSFISMNKKRKWTTWFSWTLSFVFELDEEWLISVKLWYVLLIIHSDKEHNRAWIVFIEAICHFLRFGQRGFGFAGTDPLGHARKKPDRSSIYSS